MNCANHAETPGVAFCIRCGRPLCTECMHSVRGSVYCEPCLAEIIKENAGAAAGRTAAPPSPPAARIVAGTNPGVAFALGLIPGVGAIYNGDFLKAAIHVLIFGVLTSTAGDAGGAGPLVGLAITAFYIYMPFEAYYTAKKRQLASEGVDLETPIDRLHQQFGQMRNKELWGGVALVIVGGLFLADNFNIIQVDRIGRLWPVVLIGIGVWMLRRFQGRAK